MAEQVDLFTPGVAEVQARAPFRTADPDAELRQRCARHGAEVLNEAEILQLLLARVLPPFANAEAVANGLIDRFGGVARVLGASRADLARVAGEEVAAELGLLHEVLLRALAFPLRRREVLSSWEAVKTYLRVRLVGCPREAVHVLFLDKKNQLIAEERLGQGTVDHAPIYPREVVRRALELSASAIVLAHNHPSGDATPSQADIEMTKQVVAAAKALQIAVHDHLIVGADQVASLRGLGLM
ncbi:MAG: DNA repair protein RadC [Caulobacteraceae bacterium]